MNRLKILSLVFLIFSFLSGNAIGANTPKSPMAMLEKLCAEGEYEEAIRKGENLLRRFKSSDSIQFLKTNVVLSVAAYEWYHFKLSNKYFDDAFSQWEKLNLTPQQKFVAGVELVDAAIVRDNPLLAYKIISALQAPKGTPYVSLYKYGFLKSKIWFEKGNLKQALDELDKTAFALSNLRMELGETEAIWQEMQLLALRGSILVGYGNWTKAEETIKSMELLATKKNTEPMLSRFMIHRLKAELAKSKNRPTEAFGYFVQAYNDLEGHSQHPLKYEMLMSATASALEAKLGNESHQFMRRTEMLTQKDVSKVNVFAQGYYLLKAKQLVQQGLYEQGLGKLKLMFVKVQGNPTSHNTILSAWNAMADAHEKMGKIDLFQSDLDSMARWVFQKYDENSVRYAEIQLRKAQCLYKYQGDFKPSLELYKKYYPLVAQNSSPNAPHLLVLLEGYAQSFRGLAMLDSALVKTKAACEIATVAIPNTPQQNYLKSLYAYDLFLNGNYKESIGQLMSAFEASKMLTNNENGYLAKACNLQASMFEWIGEFGLLNKQSIKATSLLLEKEEIDFLERIESGEALSRVQMAKGNYFKSERYIAPVVSLVETNANATRFLMVEPWMASLELKIKKGDIKEAEHIISKAEQIILDSYGERSVKYADFLELQSRFFDLISDEQRAMELLQKSYSIKAKAYGKSHFLLTQVLSEWAHLLIEEKKYSESDQQFEKAKSIANDALGKNSPTYANLQIAQAELFILQAAYDKALANLNEAEKYWVQKQGNLNVHIAEIYFIKGNLLYQQKKYSEAEKAYEKSAFQYQDIFNKRHPGYLKAMVGLAKVNFMRKDLESAGTLLEKILEERIDFSTKNFSIMTFAQKNGLWNEFKAEFELFNALVAQQILQKKSNKWVGKLYDFTIRTKGMLMNSDAKIRRQVFQSGDSVLVANYNEWLFEKELLAVASFYSPSQLAEEKISLEKINQNIDNLEKKINARTSIALNETKVEWLEVKNALQKNESAIEMIRFRTFNHQFTDTSMYLALILNDDALGGPEAVLLQNGKALEGKNLKYYKNTSYSKSEDEISYEAYLQKIVEKVKRGNTIYFSGDGVYSQINPEMLLDMKDKKYALDEYTFVYVTNTKDIVWNENKRAVTKANESGDYCLYGNPEFYTTTTDPLAKVIPSLQGAEKEIAGIKEILDSKAIKSTALMGNEVTEDTLKSLQNPKVLHISTHGYFNEKKDNTTTIVNNPMLNSGLLLRSAGDILGNKNVSYVNASPGVLTASEVIDLNFTKTQLVILSACETGRGQVEVGEGVYGLQRAFLVAGAKAVILSLFKVDDAATQLLMTKLYEKMLANGGDYRKAFKEAKIELKNSPNFSSPIYWGAFILVESHPSKNSIN